MVMPVVYKMSMTQLYPHQFPSGDSLDTTLIPPLTTRQQNDEAVCFGGIIGAVSLRFEPKYFTVS